MRTTTHHTFKKGLWAAGAILLAVAGQRALSRAQSSRSLKNKQPPRLPADASWAGKAKDRLLSAFDMAEAASAKLASEAGRLAHKGAGSAESLGDVALAKVQQASSAAKNSLSRAERRADELSDQAGSKLRHVIDESSRAASRLEEEASEKLHHIPERAEESARLAEKAAPAGSRIVRAARLASEANEKI